MAKKSNQAAKLKEQKKQLEIMLNGFVKVMKVEAINHFVKSFTQQGFTDGHLVKWKARKRQDRTRSGKIKQTQRAILIKSGRLRRSIKAIGSTRTSVTIGSNTPYSAFHNEGLKMKNGRRMTKRQFMGKSKQLDRIIMSKLDVLIKRIYRK